MIILPKTTLITIDVFYFYPDFPLLIQEFIWSTEDTIPGLPRIKRFLDHWEHNLDGIIHHVVLAGLDEKGPREFQNVQEIFQV